MRLQWWLRRGPSDSALRLDEAKLWAALYPVQVAEGNRPELVFPVLSDSMPSGWTQGMVVEVVGDTRPGGALFLRESVDEVWPAGPPRSSAVGAPRWDSAAVGTNTMRKSVAVRIWPRLEDKRVWVHAVLWALFAVALLLRMAGGLLGGPLLLLLALLVAAAEVALWVNSRRRVRSGGE